MQTTRCSALPWYCRSCHSVQLRRRPNQKDLCLTNGFNSQASNNTAHRESFVQNINLPNSLTRSSQASRNEGVSTPESLIGTSWKGCSHDTELARSTTVIKQHEFASFLRVYRYHQSMSCLTSIAWNRKNVSAAFFSSEYILQISVLALLSYQLLTVPNRPLSSWYSPEII